jgi:hypothetical protein
MIHTFAASFARMVDELRSDPSIVVAVAEILPPDAAPLADVEVLLGYPLAGEVAEFYRLYGGVKLVWTPKESDDDGVWDAEKVASVQGELATGRPWLFKSGDLTGAPAGCIWIPSCKQVFGSGEEWESLLGDQEDVFANYRESIGEAFTDKEQLLPFDYSSMFYDVAFLMTGSGDPKLIRGEDNGASFEDSRVVSLSDYLELLIASKGVVETRMAAMAG